MGAQHSRLENTSADQFCVTFRRSTFGHPRLRLIGASARVVDIVRRSVLRIWSPGLSADEEKDGAWEFHLVGSSADDEVKLSCVVLEDLLTAGWRVAVCSDLSCSSEQSSWFFVETAPPVASSSVFCVSLDDEDKLLLVNVPQDMVEVIRQVVVDTWTEGVKKDFHDTRGGLEMKFRGKPWNNSNEGGVEARRMLLRIIRVLARHHWVLYLSGSLHDIMGASMFFVYHFEEIATETVDTAWVLAFNRTDRIRMLEADPSVEDMVKEVVSTHWTAGIQSDGDHYGTRELKLSGNPWACAGRDGVTSRQLVTLILQKLSVAGWTVFQGVQVSRNLAQKCMIVLIRGPPKPSPHWCLSFNQGDLMRFINTPQKVIDSLINCVSKQYPRGISKQKMYYGVHQCKLNGNPWTGYSDTDHHHAHQMLLAILRTAASRGWRVVCSVDIGGSYDNDAGFPESVHSWWFNCDLDAPVVSSMMPPSKNINFEVSSQSTSPSESMDMEMSSVAPAPSSKGASSKSTYLHVEDGETKLPSETSKVCAIL